MKQKTYDLTEWNKQFDNLIENTTEILNEVNKYLLSYFKKSFETKSFNNIPWKY